MNLTDKREIRIKDAILDLLELRGKMTIAELARTIDSGLLQPVAVRPITEKIVVEVVLSLYPQIFKVTSEGSSILHAKVRD